MYYDARREEQSRSSTMKKKKITIKNVGYKNDIKII